MSQDNFSLLEQISQSPTATVYKAYQKALERVVLLKVLHKHLLRDKLLVARFTREAQSCAILHSENIVQVYDLTEIDGAPAIVMEYVEGQTLEDLLLNRSAVSEEVLLDVAVSVLKALSYAHERGIIHRDIKPSNILISENRTIKVTDFGLAAVADAPSLTMEGSLIGTPAYMSPEQARGEAVDPRTDLFSLGVTLVEVLTGEKILLGESYAECINRIQNFKLDSLAQYQAKCSPQVFEFLRRLLAPEKSSRFHSANDALQFLSTFLGEERVGIAARKTGKRIRNLAILAAALIVVIAATALLIFRPIGKDKGELNTTAYQDSTDNMHESLTPERKADPASGYRPLTGNRDVSGRAAGRPGSASDTTAQISGPGLPASNDSGYISIGRCDPWAKIFIDSAYVGQTPLSGSMKVPTGRHQVMFSNPDFTPIVREVIVEPRLLSTVDGDFLKDAGYIIVTVEPWAKVYVDDNLRETTPSVSAIPVSPGTRIIRLQNPNFQDIVRTLTVKPGDTLRLSFSFSQKGGK